MSTKIEKAIKWLKVVKTYSEDDYPEIQTCLNALNSLTHNKPVERCECGQEWTNHDHRLCRNYPVKPAEKPEISEEQRCRDCGADMLEADKLLLDLQDEITRLKTRGISEEVLAGWIEEWWSVENHPKYDGYNGMARFLKEKGV